MLCAYATSLRVHLRLEGAVAYLYRRRRRRKRELRWASVMQRQKLKSSGLPRHSLAQPRSSVKRPSIRTARNSSLTPGHEAGDVRLGLLRRTALLGRVTARPTAPWLLEPTLRVVTLIGGRPWKLAEALAPTSGAVGKGPRVPTRCLTVATGPMVSLPRCRELLGHHSHNLTDSEIENVGDQLYALACVVIRSNMAERPATHFSEVVAPLTSSVREAAEEHSAISTRTPLEI